MDIEEDINILNNLKRYLELLDSQGIRKIFYNDLDWDEKTIDCINAIEHILAEREEDKKRIERLQVLEDDLKDKRIVYVDTPEFEEKFIPKQKVKDKIEEIKEDKESKYFDKFLMTRDIDYAIEILEELLEDK